MIININPKTSNKDINIYNKINALINSGYNLFITGGAGTGKSYILQKLRHQYKNSIVCAPTGVAAINIDGNTLHKAFGIPVFDNLYTSIKAKLYVKCRKNIRDKIVNTDIIFIDEISMVRADILDFIDRRLKYIRRCNEPFGGIQVIVFGDPFQLPPVIKPHLNLDRIWFFESDCWKQADFKIIELNKVYRQNDQEFVNMLHRIRIGKPSETDIHILNSKVNNKINFDKFTTLCSLNQSASIINETKLKELPGKTTIFKAKILGDFNPNFCLGEEILKLKPGAKVISIVNDCRNEEYYNGSVGVVEEIYDNSISVKFDHLDYPVEVSEFTWEIRDQIYNKYKKEWEFPVVGSMTQIPLKLGWAITIHKSQGLTIPNLYIDNQRIFAPGQMYVALSRAISLNELFLSNKISRKQIFVDETLRKYFQL